KKQVPKYKNIKVDEDAFKLVSSLSEAILPKTSSPGAIEIGAPLFALMMVDECFSPAEQNQFMKGLAEMKEEVHKKYGKPFSNCATDQQHEILQSLEKGKDTQGDLGFFYHHLKGLTMEAFTTSKYYLTKVQVYVLAPGRFYGCVPVNK
ncbi:MAG: gluconate 2-dehydrogenase subunit 3 family protein, partial [Bacteroidota bacterium]|nr:gluconate 2-dehydrogenase subunit 3 family protein [Bacteroidota bacterium]